MELERLPAAMPLPTRDLDQALRDFAGTGICIVSEVIRGDKLRKLRDATYAAADDDREYGREAPLPSDDAFNQRVWGLMNRGPRFGELAEHPIALELVRTALGWPALLSNFSANVLRPGSGRMPLHADQSYSAEPWLKQEVMNICWCVDEFTADNGATLVAPGTHKLGRRVNAEDRDCPALPAIAPAGSMIAIDGRVWHRNGSNTADSARAGLFAVYTLPSLACSENWFLSLDPAVRQHASETLLELLGFRPVSRMRINNIARLEKTGIAPSASSDRDARHDPDA